MLAGDWDTTVAMVGEQVREGSHVIDVCVDYVGRDGAIDMAEVARRFATQSTAPLMIDSTEPAVVETALQWVGGKAILNSVNLEDGDAPGTRLDRFLSLARDYGAAVVATCIDTEGQARDRGVEAAGGQGDPRHRRRPLRTRPPRPLLRSAGAHAWRPGSRRAGATASRPSRASAASRPSSPA